MKTNRKSLGILIIILGLILLGVIIYFGFLTDDKEPVINQSEQAPAVVNQLPSGDNTPTTTPGDAVRNYQKYDISQETEHETNSNDLIKTSQAFVERFGSYSNYSNYSNFSDLKIFMTSSMKLWADNYVKELRASVKGGEEYYGITTIALTGYVEEYSDVNGTADVVVTTQRKESTSQVNDGASYVQKIDISLKKIQGEWLVDTAYWQ
jgi:hypothetical protein